MMDDLIDQFLAECRDLAAAAAADFAALAQDPRDAAALESAFRAMHTLKGSFGVFAFAPAERVLHAAEDLLERARGGVRPLECPHLTGLIATLDDIERWLDEVEQSGALGDDADAIAQRACARLSAEDPATPALNAGKTGAAPAAAWLAPLALRETAAIASAQGALTAFRYSPDRDCFFRGEDPLAIAGSVPQLLALEILPAGGAWPDLARIEPFQCFSVLEGLSAASPDAVRAAFRLMPDQVEIATLPPPLRPAPATGAPSQSGQTVRVDAARLADLANGLGDLLVTTHAMSALATAAERQDPALAAGIRAAQADLERIGAGLHRSLGAIRSVPLGSTLRRLPRLAREIGASAGKEIDFSIAGEAVEADRQIAEGLTEPLLHLLRNAIDHGIEPADRRLASGKPARGRIDLTLRRDGDMIEALLEDDGAGIDPALIRATAVARGLIDEDAAAALNDAAALRLIFLPGFSTAGAVTELSGRGVGMNAVQSAVTALRGTIAIASRPGDGTQFLMRLPAAALVTRMLVIEAGGHRYGVALDQVVEMVRTRPDQLIAVGGGLACVLRERTVPVLDLAELLGGQSVTAPVAPLLVTRSGGETVALRVDRLCDRIDTLVRPPHGLLASVPGIMGSAVHSDGGVLLVLDLQELAA